jgi:hypothetical protein
MLLNKGRVVTAVLVLAGLTCCGTVRAAGQPDEPAKKADPKEGKPREEARTKTITLPAMIEKVDAGAYVLTARSRIFQHAGKPIFGQAPDDNFNRTVRMLGHPTVDGTGRDIIVNPTRMEDLSISASAKLKAGGRNIQLTDLKRGDRVDLELTVSDGGLVIVGIERLDVGDEATYYAPKLGAVRVYEVKQGGTLVSEFTEVVTKLEIAGDWLRVSSRVTSQTSADGNRQPTSAFGPPLKLPVKVGESWTKDADPKQQLPSQSSYKVVKVEDVEVPAGTFKALRVETTLTRDDFPINSVWWYAPGVGLVKMESRLGGSVRTRTLKSVMSK